jgi:UDP:flavonoid glycosyltransferase YjiC (YdhE family)
MAARVLFTTTPGRGHWQAMLPLARAFGEHGHEVMWATAADACERLRESGFAATPAGPPEGATARAASRFPEIASLAPEERPNFLFAKIFGPARAGPMLDALLPLTRDWRPALLVSDQAELAGPIAAAAAGVPGLTHSFGPMLPRERVARAAEAMAPLWEAQGLEPRPYAGTYDHLYLDIYPPALREADRAHLGATQALRPAEPIERAAAADPLVYVTFGTVWNRDPDLIARVVEGVRELPVRVVATVGPGTDPGALGDQPPNVEVATFIPQAELLPRCVAVVSHAGSGTFLAALAAGLPQLLLPQAADQFLNAAAAARAGAGIAIPPDAVTAASVRRELERLLGDPAFRSAAERIRDQIAAMPSPGAAAEGIQARFAL